MPLLESINKIILYTGSYGKKGCTCNCGGCYLEKYGDSKPMYQGNMEQVYELLSALPNLKKANVFGNPDISVDPVFCNMVSRLLQDRGIQMAFFTSGIGGAVAIKMLLDGISLSNVKGITFSVDSLDEDMLSKIRGVKIKLQTIIDGIKYCRDLNIPFAMSLTIWPENINEDWLAYENFFKSLGAAKIVAHYGSIEGTAKSVSHIPEEKVLEVRNKYKNSSIVWPICLATDDEYKKYISDYVNKGRLKCQDGSLMYAYLEEDGVKATIFCPIFTTVYPNYFAKLSDMKGLKIPLLEDMSKCPVAEQGLGYKSKLAHPICRFYKGN